MHRTISLSIAYDKTISDTIGQFNDCANFFLGLGFENKTYSKARLQKLGYYDARKRWPMLQSSLVQGARDCAGEMLRREKLKRLPKKRLESSTRYNQRTFKAHLDSGSLSITTVGGRRRVPINIPEYFRQYVDGEVVSLRIREVHGRLMVDLVVELPDIRRKEPSTVVGVDRGVNNTAVLSNGWFFNSKAIKSVRGRYAYTRRRLQAAGTWSAKRHLKRLSGRERRFQADVNHCIAKQISNIDFDAVALEDLNIRMDKKLGRRFNRTLGGWAFGQLERFLAYKLESVGKTLVKVPPEYTSQRCSRCGTLGQRNRHSFKCPSCGLSLNADLNAARNIAQLGIALLGRPTVNGPIVAGVETGRRNTAELSYKPPILMSGS
jgi:IS605 OrfB family transposase